MARSAGGVLVVAASVAAVFGTTACSADESGAGRGAPEVATLASAPAPASAPPQAQRPRERLDGTAEDYQILVKPYDDCMKSYGQDKAEQDRTGRGNPSEKAEQAMAACGPLEPLPAWEKDPANPESDDFFRDVVKCLRDKGVEHVEVAEGGYALGGEQNDKASITKGMSLAPVCEREVAARN